MYDAKIGIYGIKNTVTGKLYVGRSLNMLKRQRRHLAMLTQGKHHSRKLQSSYDKHGVAAFECVVLLRCPADMLDIYEQALIDGYDTYRSGYNDCPTSGAPHAGKTHSPEAKEKLSKALKGLVKSEATRALLSAAQTGRKHDAERVEKNRANRLTPAARAAASAWMSGNKNAVGPKTAETKSRMSASWTPERRAAQAERTRAMMSDPDRVAAHSARMRGNTFASGKKK